MESAKQQVRYGLSWLREWRARQWAIALLIAAVAIVLLLAFRRITWSVNALDATVIAAMVLSVVAIVGAAITLVAQKKRSGASLRDGLIGLATALVLVMTLYATYGAFRNQTRLASENNLNQQATQLFGLEMHHTELRCLYPNLRQADAAACRLRIIGEEKLWSLTIFYVEEVWQILKNARADEREWGSTYSAAIDYWREDVSRDPTGMFRYFLVADAESIEEAVALAAEAGVPMSAERLCEGYGQVQAALMAAGLALSTVHCSVPPPAPAPAPAAAPAGGAQPNGAQPKAASPGGT